MIAKTSQFINIYWLLLLGLALTLKANDAGAASLKVVASDVLKTHPEVRAQWYQLQSTDEAISRAIGDYLPTLDLTASAGTEKSYDINGPDDVTLSRSELSLIVNQNLFSGFASQAELNRQTARQRIATHQLHSIRQDLLLRIATVYLDVLRYAKILELSVDVTTAHQAIRTLIEKRFLSGVGSKADLDQVQVRLSNVQSNNILASRNYQDAYSRYKVLVGDFPNDLVIPNPIDNLPRNLDDALKKAALAHPSILSANHLIDEAKADQEASTSSLYPRIDVELIASWDENKEGVNQKDHDLMGRINVRYNLFNGTKDIHTRKESIFQVNLAKAKRDQVLREIEQSVRLSWRAHELIQRQIPYLRERIKKAQMTYQSYTQQFKLGRRTLLDLLDTKAEVYRSNVDQTNAEYDYRLAQYRLIHSIGSLQAHFEQNT